MEEDIKIRRANISDSQAIWALINELAIYEKAPQEHVVTVSQLQDDIEANLFVAFVAEFSGEIAGMALAYPIYSTWKGASLYLEDIIVKQNYRRKGIGSKLFLAIVQYAAQKNAGRLGWQVLNWNLPAIAFYKKYTAELDDEWINCKLTQQQLQQYVNLNNESI